MWGKFLWAYKAESIPEFLNFFGWTAVTVKPVMRPAGFGAIANSWSIGETGSFVYLVEVSSYTRSGRVILYRQEVAKSSPAASRYGFTDSPERDKAIARTVRAAKQMADMLKSRIPGVSVILLDPSGVRMNDHLLECYLRIAE